MRRAKSGARLGKYIIGKKIGEGGFGVVRCGIHEETGERVAIKILDKSQAQLLHMTPQVKKEIGLLTTLRHENIVAGIEVLSSSSRLFLIMEFVNGGDMHSLVSKKKRLGVKDAQSYFRNLMHALHYCHSRGVYHRDLKLENLLLTKNGTLKVCDFGLASVKSNSNEASSLCTTMVGTEDYSAPEIVLGQCYAGNKVDMWSAGVILFTMLAGYCPFQGSEKRSVNQDIVNVTYSFPKTFPPEPRKVISSLLVFAPDKRPTAESVLKMPWVYDPNEDSLNHNMEIQKNLSSTHISKNESNQRPPSERLSFGSQSTDSGVDSNLSFMSAAQLIPDFLSIYAAMRDPKTGIIVADRRWRFRYFTKCFLGNEAVSWLSKYKRISRQQAVVFGQELMDAGVFHHVCREHSLSDDYLFYRFQEDDPANGHILNIRQVWSRALFTRDPTDISSELISRLIKICLSYQAKESKVVDVRALKDDPDYLVFRNATAELQTVNLVRVSDSHKIAFLVNCHNLLLMHSRIHLGRYTGSSSTSFDSKLRNFKYDVGGVPLGSDDFKNLLLFNRNAAVKESEEGDSPKDVKGTSALPPKGQGQLWKIFSNVAQQEHHPEDMQTLAPMHFKPFALFALSDGSPGSPRIRGLSASDISRAQLMNFARGHVVKHIQAVRDRLPGHKNLEAFRFFCEASNGFAEDEHLKMMQLWADEVVAEQPGSMSSKFDLVQQLELRALLFGKKKPGARKTINSVFAPDIRL